MRKGNQKPKPTLRREKELLQQGYNLVAGVDEAGMSPLAGPCVAAAVILDYSRIVPPDLTDSKLLTPFQREDLCDWILNNALAVGIGIATVEEIAEKNIYWASRSAMIMAIKQMALSPKFVLVDGNKIIKHLDIPQEAIVKGDQKSSSIAAASIIAKVTRDTIMESLHEHYPQYFFHQHKGYPTKLHKELIRQHGVCPEHRKSFKGVREYL